MMQSAFFEILGAYKVTVVDTSYHWWTETPDWNTQTFMTTALSMGMVYFLIVYRFLNQAQAVLNRKIVAVIVLGTLVTWVVSCFVCGVLPKLLQLTVLPGLLLLIGWGLVSLGLILALHFYLKKRLAAHHSTDDQ